MLVPGPPLDPSGAEGRNLLRRELLHREYHTQNPVERVLDWLDRLFSGAVGAASGVSWLATLTALAIGVVLVVGLILLLTRLRGDRRKPSTRPRALLPDDRPTALELRSRAETALAQGRHEEAVLDGFRALAARQIERGRLDDQPGATAHEVAARLAAAYPGESPQVGRTADLFDATLYGERAASVEEAGAVLALDDTLAGSR